MSDLFGGVSVADTGERNEFDYYPTPGWMTRSLLHFHPAIATCSALEPCSGDDAITRVLRGTGCVVSTNDIDPRHPAQSHYDASESVFWQVMVPPFTQWVITNPPFNVALPILQHAVAHATVGVAFLLRKTFLEPTNERGPWLAEHPPSRIIGMPRYSFRGKGSDSVSCDWMIWLKHSHAGQSRESLPPIVIDHLADQR